MSVKLSKTMFNKLFPIGCLLPYQRGKKPDMGVWKIFPKLYSEMNGKIIAKFIQRVK